MSETTTVTTNVAASPERCYELAIDYERYPDWASDIKEARIRTRDDAGRGSEVEFRAAAMGRSTSYVLRYNYGSNPLRISWRLMEGDVMKRLDGEYEFAAVDGDPDACRVTYYLSVDLAVPIPGFVRRRAEGKILHTAIAELKSRVEAGQIV